MAVEQQVATVTGTQAPVEVTQPATAAAAAVKVVKWQEMSKLVGPDSWMDWAGDITLADERWISAFSPYWAGLTTEDTAMAGLTYDAFLTCIRECRIQDFKESDNIQEFNEHEWLPAQMKEASRFVRIDQAGHELFDTMATAVAAAGTAEPEPQAAEGDAESVEVKLLGKEGMERTLALMSDVELTKISSKPDWWAETCKHLKSEREPANADDAHSDSLQILPVIH